MESLALIKQGSHFLRTMDYSKEIPILKNVPEEHWLKIYRIVNLPKLTVEQRASRLEEFLTVRQLQEIKIWMEKKAGDFFGMLTDSDQEFAEDFFEKKDVEVLDAVLDRYDENTKMVYETWKKSVGLDNKETKLEEPNPVPPTSASEPRSPVENVIVSPPSQSEPIKKITKKPAGEPGCVCCTSKKPTDEKSEPRSSVENVIVSPPIHSESNKSFRPVVGRSSKNDGEDVSSGSKKDQEKIRSKSSRLKLVKPIKPDGPGLVKDEFQDKNNGGNFKLPPGYFDNLPSVTNILILGATGVGKSTFINAFINYLSFESIQEAKSQLFHVLIKSAFTLTTDDYQTMRIEMNPTIEMERYGSEDEDTQEGHSATQLGPVGQEKLIRIIDTPGIGDTRGTLQDEKNFAKILSFISNFDEIHAILFLLEPNMARLNIAFRYCIKGLLSHLHASAAENLIFGFTKARTTFYRPGDSYGLLKSLLDDLYDQTRIRVPLNGDNMFCFDNEGFRFLCALKNGAKFSESEISDFSISWNKAVEQNFKVLDRIKQLRPHQVSDTLSVNNIRRLICNLARPLAEIAKNQLINMQMIDEKNAEIEECIAKKKNLRGRLVIETVNIETEELTQPITVCTHKDCVEYKALNNGGVVETIYKTECHAPCYLKGVETSVCPNQDLLKCEIFADPERCSNCGHSWQLHMHMKYRLIQDITRTEDPLVGKEVRNNDSQIATARRFIAEQKAQRDERQMESDKIQDYCAHFAAFLKKHSIVPYNDSYLEYLEHLIKEEKNKFAVGGSNAILKELESYRDAYKQQKIIFSEGSKVQVKSLEEINKMVKELEYLTFSGEIVQGIKNLELLSVKKNYHHNNTVAVSLESSLIRRAFCKFLPNRFANAFADVLGVS